MARQDAPAAAHPVHTAHVMHKKCSVSCLSRRSERKVGFHGLLNLAFLVLVLVNFRLIVANWCVAEGGRAGCGASREG